MPEQYYADIFKHSGHSYHRAMLQYPDARDEEFSAVINLLEFNQCRTLLDIPAGGGYLQKYLPPHLDYVARDFSSGFVESSIIKGCSEIDFDVSNNSFDIVVCLAALHHVENLPGFLAAAKKALRQDGVLLIGDVIEGSKQDEFLNVFVNKFNSLGHHGHFINEPRLGNELKSAGFKFDYMVIQYSWNFDSQINTRKYLRLLFNLDEKPSDLEIDIALQKLGCKQGKSSFQLDWQLGFFRAKIDT